MPIIIIKSGTPINMNKAIGASRINCRGLFGLMKMSGPQNQYLSA